MDIPLKCIHCGKMGEKDEVLLGAFNDHNEKHHPDFTFQCRICPNVFFTFQERKKHEETDHKKILCVQYWTRLMTMEFVLPKDMKAHYSKKHPFCKKECNLCHNSFQAETQKKFHKHKWHRFSSKSHGRAAAATAAAAGGGGRGGGSAGAGAGAGGDGSSRMVGCLNCKKSFSSPSDLEKHNKAHHSDKKFKCPRCSNRFKVSRSVDNHKCPFK